MTGQRTTLVSRLFTSVLVLLVIGFASIGLAAWSGWQTLWRLADLFFDLRLLVTMVGRSGALLRP